MSLLLLLTGAGDSPPSSDAVQQHLLLALQWEAESDPTPTPESQQHLLLALMWTPGDVVVPPDDTPVAPPTTGPTGGGGGGFFGGTTYWPLRENELSAGEILQLKREDEILLAFVMAFVEVERAWEH